MIGDPMVARLDRGSTAAVTEAEKPTGGVNDVPDHAPLDIARAA